MKLVMFRGSGFPGYDAISLDEWFRVRRVLMSSSSRVSSQNLLGLHTLEDEGKTILRNVDNHLSNDTASYPGCLDSPGARLQEYQNSRLMSPYKTFRSKAAEMKCMVAF
jgi:hypothetical protein